MLRIILLSLVWAICATCLVRPWFWKGVKNKNLFTDGVRIGFDREWKGEAVLEVVCFVGAFLISMISYDMLGFLDASFTMIALCFLAQCFLSNQGKIRYAIMYTVAAISAILCIQDIIVGWDISIPLNKVDCVPLSATNEVKLFISESEIESLFHVDSASGPTYNNGKYIYTVSGGNNGKGIVIIEKDNYTEAHFLSCSYELNVREVRSQYPTQKLKELYITISDDNVPYGLFAVADKSWILGTYKVNYYIMLNLITGEIQEFKQEELPKFATNN